MPAGSIPSGSATHAETHTLRAAFLAAQFLREIACQCAVISSELLYQCFQIEIVVPAAFRTDDGHALTRVYPIAQGVDGD